MNRTQLFKQIENIKDMELYSDDAKTNYILGTTLKLIKPISKSLQTALKHAKTSESDPKHIKSDRATGRTYTTSYFTNNASDNKPADISERRYHDGKNRK